MLHCQALNPASSAKPAQEYNLYMPNDIQGCSYLHATWSFPALLHTEHPSWAPLMQPMEPTI